MPAQWQPWRAAPGRQGFEHQLEGVRENPVVIEDVMERARVAFSDASALAQAYSDQLVFPVVVQIDRGPNFDFFPAWDGSEVLVLCHENQGVVTWGLDLDAGGESRVIVGGDLEGARSTEVYVSDVESFARCRLWDLVCLDSQPLLQAQADPLDEASLRELRANWHAESLTFGWPARANYRFERDSLRLMIWAGREQADWWLSGPPAELEIALPSLRELSNLDDALWSNDEAGTAILG